MSGPTLSGVELPVLERGLLTTTVVQHLSDQLAALRPTQPSKVGRGVAPPKAGWTKGQPGEGTFVDYVVVRTGVARPDRLQPATLKRTPYSWECVYRFTSYGVNDSGVDDLAHSTRIAVGRLFGAKVTFGAMPNDQTWLFQQVGFAELGDIKPSSTSDRALWETTDTVSLWLSPVRAA